MSNKAKVDGLVAGLVAESQTVKPLNRQTVKPLNRFTGIPVKLSVYVPRDLYMDIRTTLLSGSEKNNFSGLVVTLLQEWIEKYGKREHGENV